MPGQRETKRQIKLIKSLVKKNSKCVHLPVEICLDVWKRGLRSVVSRILVYISCFISRLFADTLTPELGVFCSPSASSLSCAILSPHVKHSSIKWSERDLGVNVAFSLWKTWLNNLFVINRTWSSFEVLLLWAVPCQEEPSLQWQKLIKVKFMWERICRCIIIHIPTLYFKDFKITKTSSLEMKWELNIQIHLRGWGPWLLYRWQVDYGRWWKTHNFFTRMFFLFFWNT